MSALRDDPAIIALSETGAVLARRIQAALKSGEVLALEGRVSDCDRTFSNAGAILHDVFAANRPIVGVAKFNVTPLRAAKYFNKIKCFCEDGQELKPLQPMRFGVAYFISPKIATDPDTRDIKTVTLSYTFFPAKPETKTVAQLSTSN